MKKSVSYEILAFRDFPLRHGERENLHASLPSHKTLTSINILLLLEFTKCHYPADIAFVLDSSTSVSYDDFERIKSFVKTMAKLFRIFQHGSRGAVIVYGDTARVAIRMDEYINYRGFIDAVDSVGRIGGRRSYYIVAMIFYV